MCTHTVFRAQNVIIVHSFTQFCEVLGRFGYRHMYHCATIESSK